MSKSSGKYWYTARVKNDTGVHAVFYSTSRPKIGDSCPGIAAPNKVIGYKREKRPI